MLAGKERVASAPQREQLARIPKPSVPKEKGTELSVQITRLWGGRKSRQARAVPLQEKRVRAKA